MDQIALIRQLYKALSDKDKKTFLDSLNQEQKDIESFNSLKQSCN